MALMPNIRVGVALLIFMELYYTTLQTKDINILILPLPTYWSTSSSNNPDILDIFAVNIPSNLH